MNIYDTDFTGALVPLNVRTTLHNQHILISVCTGLTGNEKEWSDNRNFLLRSMKTFGVGKSSLEDLVALEVLALVESLKKDVGKATELDGRLDVAVLNIIWKLSTGNSLIISY